jgi:hypothetical protein
VRLALRYAFAFKRPARVTLSERGLQIESTSSLLGRVLRSESTAIPLENLATVTREARFARAGFYAGLVSMVVGTYLGVGLFIDGVRAPGMSPSLLGLGILIVGLGLAVDFALVTFLDADRERVRLVVHRKKGRPLSITGLDRTKADALLRQVLEQPRAPSRAPLSGSVTE